MTITPRDQAAAVIRRAAHLSGCDPESVVGRNRMPAADLARVKAYWMLHHEYGWGAARIARFFGRSKGTVSKVLSRAREAGGVSLREPVRAPVDDRLRDRLEDLEVFVRRVTGQHLVYPLRDRLSLPMWQALPLAIIVEAYPRIVSIEAICEQYEHAALALKFGNGQPISVALVKGAVSKIRARFAALGLPDPIVAIRPHGFRITAEMHPWFVANFDLERGVLAAV